MVSERVDELLTQVGLGSNVKNRYPNTFSGGQKQRIAIARALAADPELLVADELVSGLDVSIQAKIINLLDDLQREYGLSVLIISHNLGVVRTIANYVNIMYLGEIVERGDCKDVFDNPAHPYTRALLSSVNSPDPDVDANRIILEGEAPDPSNPPSGCSFHTRCPEYIEGICDVTSPSMMDESQNDDWPVIGQRHESKCQLLCEDSESESSL